jgi:hypothetical protein
LLSIAFMTTVPAPSHWLTRQSPAVCVDVGVPAGAYEKSQAFEAHVRARQSVSEPGHVDATTQPTQWPAPSQTWVPPHDVPWLFGAYDGTPFVHVGVSHELLSSGRSLSSTAETTWPAPSHWF